MVSADADKPFTTRALDADGRVLAEDVEPAGFES